MTRWAGALLLWVGVFAALGSACSARSIVIGGDPLGNAGAPDSGGTSTIGGSSTTGGFGTGGTLVPIGGTSGQGALGGTAGAFDPYPPVAWEDGQGYRQSCPHYDEVWGFTCWNFDGATRSCKLNGDPYCNVCSCAVPCDEGCPRGVTGHPADCLASETTVHSCFLVCDDGRCPDGMICAPYPGVGRLVCMWPSDPPFVPPPL